MPLMIEPSFSSKSLGKIHRRSTLEEFRLSLFLYRPSSPIELTENPVSRELKWSGKRPRLSNLTTRDLNLVFFAWMKERGD